MPKKPFATKLEKEWVRKSLLKTETNVNKEEISMFQFPNHEERFEGFLQRDGTHTQEVERNAMFYIFAGNDELRGKMGVFYDLDHRMIRTEGFGEVGLSSSATALIRLAFNLYNNYPCGTVVELFSNLDERNLQLAFQGIQSRFNVKGI